VSLTDTNKLNFINTIKEKLSQFSEVNKVILFGSFIKSSNPNDNFLTLSLKYRKVLRELSKKIPLDIVPIRANANGVFLDKINKGQIVYER